MRKTRLWMMWAIATCCVAGFNVSSCKEERVEILPVSGVLDEKLPNDTAPAVVYEAIHRAFIDRFENVLDDRENHVSVWSLVNCNPDVSSEGFGIIVTKDKESTKLPDLHHGKNPAARYDAQEDVLWLSCGDMEGTGVLVERLHKFRFSDDNSAHIVSSLDPYDVQQALLERLGYSINGERITFYDGEQELCVSTNHTTDMGGFDEENPVWIGEQIRYDLTGESLSVHVTPGVKFTTGLVLTYDDMPTLSASVTLKDDGSFALGELEVVEDAN
ncbi:MAG: hypothetical protein II402_06105 [Bacteroidaceae bacterium]|nr:hypothetical protein [Bacteroidaceae bacterium]MBQ2341359.1 hypothetical protein [Bacteroidaceae bacterium]